MRSTRQPLPHHTQPAARGRVARRSHAASRQSLLPLLLIVVSVALSAPAAAQQRAAPGVVAGTVRGAGVALGDAHVTVAGSQLGSVSGPNGQFLISGVPAGQSVLEVRLIGYRPISRPIIVVPGDSLVLTLELEVDPVRLDALEGRALAGLSAEMRGFYERRERGTGHYFTRDDITRMHARLVTDVVRRVPGVRVEPLAGPMGTSYVIRMQRATGMSGARPCPVVYFVNGVPFSIAAEIGINSYFRADEIAAMEVYSGASQLPPQFSLSSRNTRCGVIALWTYAGERRQDP
jgi:hypothetical protein